MVHHRGGHSGRRDVLILAVLYGIARSKAAGSISNCNRPLAN